MTGRADRFIEFNPSERIAKGTIAPKISMDMLQPFARKIESYSNEAYSGGAKFRNGDTIMARITPCLENGKTAYVDLLPEDAVGFGSTEFIVMRAKEGVTIPKYVYYLATSEGFRQTAIKSMAGTSGRQRVQVDVLQATFISVPDISTQKEIVRVLTALDDKIELNNQINKILQDQAFAAFEKITKGKSGSVRIDDIAFINHKRKLVKRTLCRCIDMSQLSTSMSFPSGWEYKPYNGGSKFVNGDTLLARITPCLENGKTAYIDFLNEDEIAFGSTEYIVMSPKNNLYSEFLYCLARSQSFRQFAIKSMNGSSGRQRVQAEVVSSFLIPEISEEEIKSFKSMVEPIFKLIRHNFLQNRELIKIRNTIHPQIMSGNIEKFHIGKEVS